VSADFAAPHALVLGGGGILGEAWMTAVLAGLEQGSGFDPRGCERYVGTSAGSIVAAHLVAGEAPRSRLRDLPEQPPIADRSAGGPALVAGQAARAAVEAAELVAAPLAAAALRVTSAGGALARRLALSRVAPGRRSLASLARAIERTRVRFDGRLLISAVDLGNGRRVMFGGRGAPPASVAEAVEASCSIPGFFQPVVIGDRTYVDGGVWSPTNMDVLRLDPGKRVLCLNPTASIGAARSAPLAAYARASRSIAALEALALRRRRTTVTTVAPDGASAAAIGGNLMEPSRRDDVIEAGFAQGLTLADMSGS
jgi:NTE family protein